MDTGVSPWFVVGGIIVLVGLVLFLNWTRSQRWHYSTEKSPAFARA